MNKLQAAKKTKKSDEIFFRHGKYYFKGPYSMD